MGRWIRIGLKFRLPINVFVTLFYNQPAAEKLWMSECPATRCQRRHANGQRSEAPQVLRSRLFRQMPFVQMSVPMQDCPSLTGRDMFCLHRRMKERRLLSVGVDRSEEGQFLEQAPAMGVSVVLEVIRWGTWPVQTTQDGPGLS